MAIDPWCIKDGYVENPGPVYFLDDATSDRGIVFQPDVYTLADYLVEVHADTDGAVVDVGCGWGEKLAGIHDRHPEGFFVGVDYGANIAHCVEAYSWGSWLEADLDDALSAVGALGDLGGAIAIFSDVIEHLVDPRVVLDVLRDAGPVAVVLSTPERDMQHGYDHMGPSTNLCHVREWNAGELRAFLEQEGWTVRHQGLTRGSDQGWAMATQLVVCTP